VPVHDDDEGSPLQRLVQRCLASDHFLCAKSQERPGVYRYDTGVLTILHLFILQLLRWLNVEDVGDDPLEIGWNPKLLSVLFWPSFAVHVSIHSCHT